MQTMTRRGHSGTRGNNPTGYPATLRPGHPRPGVALPAQRVRMPDEESAAALLALLEAAPRTGRAALLGDLLAEALRARGALE